MKDLKIIQLLVLFLGISTVAFSQEIVISNGGSYTGCGGSIVDTGAGPGEYSANENITFTICPEDPDSVITLYFVIFSLGEGDVMSIYQGENSDAPLEGIFVGSELGAQNITTSADNESGCITVEFFSDGDDNGNFAMVVDCGPPCENPEAIIDAGGESPLLVCPDEVLTFDGTGSTFADGAALESFEWDFGDGITDTTSGLLVEHAFSEPGAYSVQLTLVDDNDCPSINLPQVQVFVGTAPSFEGTLDTLEICLGEETFLTELLGEVEGTLWNGEPESPIGGYLEIPDDQSQCFNSEVTFSNFNATQVVESASDIQSVFVNMEHSFMGDLTISLICPDGTQVVMHEQEGGGTFLGEPNDPDMGMEIEPGIGYDYWWAPDAPNGTWAEESGSYSTLPSGTYSSVQSFDNLIGCPLNGTWTLQICDLWAIDNGVVFDWTMSFDPSLYPDIISFTPVYGADCDSSYWTGPYIVDTMDSCNTIAIMPDTTGIFTYTFNVTDNHGCSYSHDAVVVVDPGPLADIPDQEVSFCGQPVQIFAEVTNFDPEAEYVYVWTPAEGLSNPNVADPFVVDISGDQEFTVMIYEEGEEVCGSEATVLVEYVNPVFSEQDAEICEGTPYLLPGGYFASGSGTYIDTIPSVVTGCDSVVTTHLTINPVFETEVNVTLCNNDSILLPDGTYAFEDGAYPVTLFTVSGCDSTIITNVSTVVVDAGQYDPVCHGIISLSGSSTPEEPGSLSWSGPDELEFNAPNNPNSQVSSEQGGFYIVELTDSRCPNDPATAELTFMTQPEVEITSIDFICMGETATAELILEGDYNTNSDFYVWQDLSLGLFDMTQGDQLIINSELFEGVVPFENYQVQVLIPGLAPCLPATDTLHFDVIDCEITIPDVFTPNGDGVNDVFEITGISSFQNSRMTILNRWGKVVYESENYGEPFWNGTHQNSGAEMADGVYYYELIMGRTEEVYSGTVTIFRD